VDAAIAFAQGPLFRLTFSIMLLGLIRLVVLDIINAVEAYRRAGDRSLAWSAAIGKTISWLFPLKRAFTQRPVYSVLSIVFHIGLIAVPVFLLAHIQLWHSSLGVSWWSLPPFWADLLTITTIVAGAALFFGRVGQRSAQALSRTQDYLWPLLLITPFITGYVCANTAMGPTMYQVTMLVHLFSAELIFLLIPFTKIAHCVLMPLSQFIIALAWRFPARVDDKICTTLRKKGAGV
jgi:nitrate reductase gamma subunit